MNKDILNLEPSNLPVYVYKLKADVALIVNKIAYKIQSYAFTDIRVAANQPLKSGDIVTASSCYFGDKNFELFEHLSNKGVLRGAEIESEDYDYRGCLIDELIISFVDTNSLNKGHVSCGEGKCTVFIGLIARNTSSQYPDLFYWQSRISNWDERLECIGEIPKNLPY